MTSFGADNWIDEEAPLRPLRSDTIAMRRFQPRQAFSILVLCGQQPETITGLADPVQPEHAEKILTFFWERSDKQPSAQAAGMAHCLLTLAQHRVKLAERAIRRIQNMKQRVTPRSTGLTPKNRATLRTFDDEKKIKRLLLFPETAMQRGTALKEGSPRKAALQAQKAVAVEILTMMPLRLRNLSTLHIEKNFEWRGSRLFIIIPPEPVKNEEPIEFELLAPSVSLIKF